LDVTIVRGQEAQAADLELLKSIDSNPVNTQYVDKLFRRVVNESLFILQVNPSYGCQLLAIAKAVRIELAGAPGEVATDALPFEDFSDWEIADGKSPPRDEAGSL
jgi:hypothetical protein